MIDKATNIRSGEELDLDVLSRYCQENLPDFKASLEVLQFPSGYSNLTYLLRAGDQEWVLRRPPFGANIKGGHDMSREHRVLEGLKKVYDNVPTPILLCEDVEVLGAPFYIMERIHGLIIRDQLPKHITRESQLRTLSESAIDNLAAIHSLDIEKAGLQSLGRPSGYVERQIGGWTRRYQRSRTDEIPQMEFVSRWLEENRPPEAAVAMLHNDYKYDNLILDPNSFEIKAVLDWEMATIGCPLMDLGCALAYWVQPDDPAELHALPLSATRYPRNLSRSEAAQRYAGQTGFDIENLHFHFAFGLWRLAVILQQIYSRYTLGHTKDPRFSNMINGVRVVARRAREVIENESL